jgi:small-conductance mechanosensitive channel
VITVQTPTAEALTAVPPQAATPVGAAAGAAAPPSEAALAAEIDAQARRVDQLSAAILRATAQLSWSGRAADRFRDRAAERARECLQLAVALRASATRVKDATPKDAAKVGDHAR